MASLLTLRYYHLPWLSFRFREIDWSAQIPCQSATWLNDVENYNSAGDHVYSLGLSSPIWYNCIFILIWPLSVLLLLDNKTHIHKQKEIQYWYFLLLAFFFFCFFFLAPGSLTQTQGHIDAHWGCEAQSQLWIFDSEKNYTDVHFSKISSFFCFVIFSHKR